MIGNDDDLVDSFSPDAYCVAIAVGPSTNTRRKEIWDRISAKGYSIAKVVHPSADISSAAILGSDVQIMAGAVIQPKATILSNSVVNTRASVDHGTVVGAHSHVAPGATLCGDVLLEESVYVGAGAVIMPGARIGKGAIVGAGSVVKNDVNPRETIYGFH